MDIFPFAMPLNSKIEFFNTMLQTFVSTWRYMIVLSQSWQRESNTPIYPIENLFVPPDIDLWDLLERLRSRPKNKCVRFFADFYYLYSGNPSM